MSRVDLNEELMRNYGHIIAPATQGYKVAILISLFNMLNNYRVQVESITKISQTFGLQRRFGILKMKHIPMELEKSIIEQFTRTNLRELFEFVEKELNDICPEELYFGVSITNISVNSYGWHLIPRGGLDYWKNRYNHDGGFYTRNPEEHWWITQN